MDTPQTLTHRPRWFWPLIALLALAFAYLVWPSPYRYTSLGGQYPVRVNRLTGRAEMLRGDGWQPMQPRKLDPIEQILANRRARQRGR
jgi:hypothetical protein